MSCYVFIFNSIVVICNSSLPLMVVVVIPKSGKEIISTWSCVQLGWEEEVMARNHWKPTFVGALIRRSVLKRNSTRLGQCGRSHN